MTPETVGVIAFVLLIGLLVLRVPVGLAMIGVAIWGFSQIIGWRGTLGRISQDFFREAGSYSLAVIPMFVLMGLVLANSGLGKDLYAAFDAWLWRVRGGLGVATVGASAMFAAVNGSAVASATTMSLVAVPEMKRFDYDDAYAAGTTAVGGTLGALIPPSAVLVLYALLTEESIPQTLVGGILPGVMTAVMLMFTAWLLVKLKPSLAPRDPVKPALGKWKALGRVWAVPVIFGVSMGGLLLGWFVASEAGAVGAASAILFGVITRRLSWKGFVEAVSRTVRVSAMIFLLVMGGKMFGYFLSITRIPQALGRWIDGLDVTPWLVVAAVFVIYFALGALMDEIAILVIMTPITYPIVVGTLGYDGVWFGVLSIMMLLAGLLQPPVGVITFVVAGITKIPLATVFRGIMPFVVTLAVAVMLVIWFPEIAMYLPEQMRENLATRR